MRSDRKPILKALTGLRFFAAIYVVLFHYLLAEKPELYPNQYLGRFISYGYSGVSLFFILSGFVLAYNYSNTKIDTFSNSIKFWIARFARIYPLYLMALVISLPGFINRAIEAENVIQTWSTFLLNPLLLQAWTPWTSCQWNCPGWAVSTEVFCYALFPIISVHLCKLKKNKLLLVSLILWLTSLIAPVLYLIWLSKLQPADVWLRFVIYSPIFHLPQFIIGVITGILFLRRFQNRVNEETSVLARPPEFFLMKGGYLSSILLIVILILFLFFNMQYVLINNGLLAPLFALLIYALGFERSYITSLLSLPGFIFLGETSYAIYLMHLPVNSWIVFIGGKLGYQGIIGSPNFLIMRISILLVVSTLMLLLIEIPARKRILKHFLKS